MMAAAILNKFETTLKTDIKVVEYLKKYSTIYIPPLHKTHKNWRINMQSEKKNKCWSKAAVRPGTVIITKNYCPFIVSFLDIA